MPVADTAPYQVLARKYRPQRFDDLIGQEAMVTTLRNAFNSGRIAHAYILTGVRGVGKTTTARILARALNFVGPEGEDDGPKIDMAAQGRHCRAIAESRHPDVLEMDAASRTGVSDVRELIEGVRYAPLEARYKVYIIDEVHMLSTAAFNALLKTLEEPPPHVKFIFATTEIRKVPVTVLSRCQRFDLRRVSPEILARHLRALADQEGVAIDDESLAMIARAAEGSVRDSLSLLDQALVQGAGASVSAELVRAMLRRFGTGGFDAAGEADAMRAREIAARLPMNALTRAWSLLMRGIAETREAPDAEAAGEMAIIRMAYAADLPTPDEALRMLKDERGGAAPAPQGASQNPFRGPTAGASPALSAPHLAAPLAASGTISGAAAAQAFAPPARASLPQGPLVSSFADVVRLAGQKRDSRLKVELESYAHLIGFSEGRIDLRVEDRAPSDFAGRLAQRLKEWTGRHWVISLANEGGAATLRDARTAEVMAHPFVRRAFELFPDAEIRAIRDPVEAPAADIIPEDLADEMERS